MANGANIELALFAPYNEVVELIGDFSGWKPLAMSRGDDGWWRVSVELSDGDHLYKFRVKSLSYFAMGETLDVFDPYALHVTNDEHENSIVRVKDGQRVWTEYVWRHDDVPLPQNEELVIYELFVGDFGGTNDRRGVFTDVIARLDSLQDLGINCIELMPVKFFPGQGWGYNLRSLFAVASVYGSADELCQLVDECHARGIRVVIDGVYNHADSESPLAKIAYGYWYYEQNPDQPEMQWGPKFNYGHFDENLGIFPARKYVIESIPHRRDPLRRDPRHRQLRRPPRADERRVRPGRKAQTLPDRRRARARGSGHHGLPRRPHGGGVAVLTGGSLQSGPDRAVERRRVARRSRGFSRGARSREEWLRIRGPLRELHREP